MSTTKNENAQDEGKREDIGIKTIELRLTSVKEAMQRTRFVFIVMTIASSAILFTLWNNRFSRDKDYAFAPEDSSYSKTVINHDRPEPINIFGRKELVGEWYKNRIIQIGLLGIRLSVSDLSLIGSFTLVVITIWFYYCQRRENEALVSLLRDVNKEYKDKSGLAVRNMVYQGIKNGLIFIRTEESDEALVGLEDTANSSSAQNKISDEVPDKPENASVEHKTFTDRVLRFLSFLPFWTILAIILHDFSALFMKSPPSGSDLRLGAIIWGQLKWGSVGELWNTGYPILLIIVFDSFAIACAIYTRRLCVSSRAFGQGSKETLRQFEKQLIEDKQIASQAGYS